jgi:hypothetical protein
MVFEKRGRKMLEFLAGLVAGGIIGVVCDRLWQKVEKRVRLRICGGFRHGIDGDGIWFKVTNAGKERLPPIRLCVFAPEQGSYYIFPASSERERNDLWPSPNSKGSSSAEPVLTQTQG